MRNCLLMPAVALGELYENSFSFLEMSKRVRLLCGLGLVMTIALEAAAQCDASCEREMAPVWYGFDAALRSVEVDVGSCRYDLSNCSVEEVSALQSNCVPHAYELRPFNNRSGPFLARVIESCQSMDVNRKCERVEVPTNVFPVSPYRMILRTGVCYGTCNGSEASCVPTSEVNIIAHGPNGPIPIPNILSCGCMAPGRCYREDHFESHWQLIETTTDNVTMATVSEKLINVGKCVGSCPLGPERCFPSEDDCRLRLPGSRLTCAPQSSVLYTYTDLSGATVSVATVGRCDCLTG